MTNLSLSPTVASLLVACTSVCSWLLMLARYHAQAEVRSGHQIITWQQPFEDSSPLMYNIASNLSTISITKKYLQYFELKLCKAECTTLSSTLLQVWLRRQHLNNGFEQWLCY